MEVLNNKITIRFCFLLASTFTIIACEKTTLEPTTSTTSNTTPTTGTTTATSNTTVPDTSFVLIPANASFAFNTNVTNKSATEVSPITADYYMNKYFVTNAQYKAFCEATNHAVPKYWANNTYPTGKAEHPVLSISLTAAQEYCTWLGTKNSAWTFRLPTEAEWENAAAGPNKYTYPWGNSANNAYSNGVLTSHYNYNGVCSAYYLGSHGSDLATYTKSTSPLYNQKIAINKILTVSSSGGVSGWKDETNIIGFAFTDIFDTISAAGGFTTPVGAYPKGKSAYGLYDMAGNVWTWTSSLIIASNGAEKGQQVNAIRGGSWYSNSTSAKTNYRGEGRVATGAFNTVGFRLAATKK